MTRNDHLFLCLLFIIIGCVSTISNAQVVVELELQAANHMTIVKESDGSYTITTTGQDPNVRSHPLGTIYPEVNYMLSFEYISQSGINDFQLYFGTPFSEARKILAGNLPATAAWSKHAINLKTLSEDRWKDHNERIRLDFGAETEKDIRLRNIVLRAPTAEELDDMQNSDFERNKRLLAYQTTHFPDQINSVKVHGNELVVSGQVEGSTANKYLIGLAIHDNPYDNFDPISVYPLASRPAEFEISLSRYHDTSPGLADHLYTRWAIACLEDDVFVLTAPARYADEVFDAALQYLPEPAPTNLKGMGGVTYVAPRMGDLNELGIRHISLNIVLNAMLSDNPTQLKHDFNGKAYYINQNYLTHFDNVMSFCKQSNIAVWAILLIQSGASGAVRGLLRHPDNNGGHYSLANVVAPEGAETYAAIIDFLAQRYNQPNSQFALLQHYIIHNEVDAAPVWTNAGNKPQDLYMDQYQRSMRIVYYTARRHHPQAKVYISLTHFWTDVHTYKVKDLLTGLQSQMSVEGDFEWGVAYHPYPRNLRNPRTWEDVDITNDFNTRYITPRNLHLIDAWMRKENNLYKGEKMRTLTLSEQGISAPDYSVKSMTEQAAGIAYFWKKVKELPSVESFLYHRWTDHPLEGNLLFGLWTFDPADPKVNAFHSKKPSWDVYHAAGTDNEDAVFEEYMPTIGITNWDQIFSGWHFVPETNPVDFHVRVVRDGEPLAGVKVELAGSVHITNHAGEAFFRKAVDGREYQGIATVNGEEHQFVMELNGSQLYLVDIQPTTAGQNKLQQNEIFTYDSGQKAILLLDTPLKRPAHLRVVGMHGMVVLNEDVGGRNMISLNALAPGVYVASVQTGHRSQTKKIVVW